MDAHHQQSDGAVPSRLRFFARLWPHEDELENARRSRRNIQNRFADRWRKPRNAGTRLGDDGSVDPVHGVTLMRPGNAILLNGVVQTANREIGVPERIATEWRPLQVP